MHLYTSFTTFGRIVIAVCFVWVGSAWAQGVAVPSSAEPSAIQGRTAVLPPLRADALVVPDDKNLSCTFGPGLAGVRITLRQIKLEGAEQFPGAELSLANTGLPVGQAIVVNDICTATRRLTRDIRNAGYVFSRAYLPEQDITDGNLVFQFQAVRVGDVRVEGQDPGGFLAEIGEANHRVSLRASLHRFKGEVPCTNRV